MTTPELAGTGVADLALEILRWITLPVAVAASIAWPVCYLAGHRAKAVYAAWAAQAVGAVWFVAGLAIGTGGAGELLLAAPLVVVFLGVPALRVALAIIQHTHVKGPQR